VLPVHHSKNVKSCASMVRMETSELDTNMLRSFKGACGAVLRDFAASTSSFKLVRTIPHANTPPATAAKTLYVLDSSFNPPTKAHHRIATSALSEVDGLMPQRLLLLLATQNADKATKPASLEDRLVMMTLFAHEMLYDVKQQFPLLIDVGLAKQPYFHDKAAAIDESGVYSGSLQQVHLIGFDTLVRIFNTKYYPPDHNLRVLEPFLSEHRLRTTYRTDDEWGSRQEQEQYIQDIADGKRDHEGARREWARQLTVVEGRQKSEDLVSSTLARAAAKKGAAQLDKYVMPTVRDWILSEKLYLKDD
jgi:nicotinamide-nucleotide adenylyltransferase